jgi:hypothetical protein
MIDPEATLWQPALCHGVPRKKRSGASCGVPACSGEQAKAPKMWLTSCFETRLSLMNTKLTALQGPARLGSLVTL